MVASSNTTIAALNGKYKSGAPTLYELIKYPESVTLRIGLGSGKPVHPFFMPLLAAGTVIYGQDDRIGILTGADVVLCYIASHAGLQAQLDIIKAAAELGCKLFVTCEFGLDWDKISAADARVGKQPLVALRKESIELIEKLGMSHLKVLAGVTPENVLADLQQHPYIDENSTWGWQLADKKVTIYGTGDVPVTWTPARYLAESFAKLLATKSVDELAALKEIRLSGYTATQNDIVKLYEAAYGVTLDVTYVPLDEVEQIEADLFAAGGGEGVVNYWTQWPAFIRAQIAKGNALLDGPFTTVEGATLPEWKDVLSNLPVTV